jgi:hypothetical protein
MTEGSEVVRGKIGSAVGGPDVINDLHLVPHYINNFSGFPACSATSDS